MSTDTTSPGDGAIALAKQLSDRMAGRRKTAAIIAAVALLGFGTGAGVIIATSPGYPGPLKWTRPYFCTPHADGLACFVERGVQS